MTTTAEEVRTVKMVDVNGSLIVVVVVVVVVVVTVIVDVVVTIVAIVAFPFFANY